MYEGIQSEVINTTTYYENSYLSTTYLGRLDMTRASKIKADERFPISKQGYTIGKLLNVRYYWIQELANHLCPNNIIYAANPYIHY